MRKKLQKCSTNHGSAGKTAFSRLLEHSELFASYIGDDPIGIELAGALKNVYAIATGTADGLGFENNTRASQHI
jgi:glycerol-3-phosphate dehydrogenase